MDHNPSNKNAGTHPVAGHGPNSARRDGYISRPELSGRALRKQGIFPSMERAFCCPICRRQSCAPPLLTFTAKRQKPFLPSAVERFAPLVGKAPQQVRITSAKTRWGSCSAKGGLNFSWRLLCAPPEAMDYVVVHELAHLIEFNHSSRFWAIVEGILPDYKARRQSLKEVQESLLRQGW